MTEDQRIQYQGLITLLNRDVGLRWKVAEFFTVIHLAGLTALTTGFFESLWHIAGVASVGVILSLFWIFAIVRMEFWIRNWVWLLAQIEQGGQTGLKPFTLSMTNLDRGQNTTELLTWLAGLSIRLWILTAYLAIIS